MCKHAASHVNEGLERYGFLPASHCKVSKRRWGVAEVGARFRRLTRRPALQLLTLALRVEAARCGRKAGSTQGCSQAVPHPSTNRALCRLTSEVRRDPVHSTRYGRQRKVRLPERNLRAPLLRLMDFGRANRALRDLRVPTACPNAKFCGDFATRGWLAV